MAVSMKNVDPAFQGVGQKAGMDIWRIQDFQPTVLPKSDFGKFYSGDSYIILRTTALKSGAYHYDVHFWLGKDTSQDEAGTAAIKTVELDAALGGRAVQYREVQGHETDKFLSYFKPCIIPLEGGVASGFKSVSAEKFEPRLYICKGRRVVRVKQVPCSRSSLNHDDIFILDTEFKIYQFNGATSNIQERAKSLEVVQYIKDTYHDGKCDVAVIDDGKLVAEADTGEFWSFFGGFAPIGKRAASEDDSVAAASSGKLYCIAEGQLTPIEASSLSKNMLESNKCYLLDCGVEVYVWVGRISSLDERKAASTAAEEYLMSQKRPKSTHITRIIQGFETVPFRSAFDEWPLGGATAVSEDGRGKVAALLKQQGLNVKGLLKGAPSKEDMPPLFDKSGKLEVWRIDGSTKSGVATTDIAKFYTGDCYLVLYTYPGDRRDEYFLCCWLGKQSIQEEQAAAYHLASQIANSYKGRPAQVRIWQGKEPAQFVALFQTLFILQGGLSSGYKKRIPDQGSDDDTYNDTGEALIQVQGAGLHDNKAVQVDLDAACLNSSYCYILQTATSVFVWNGNATTAEEQQVALKAAECLKPGTTPKVLKEGSEPAAFWNPLGDKKSYSNQREVKETGKDPRLFAYSIVKDKLETTEVFNFAQDDLLTEDVMILDTYTEIFAWVGQHSDMKEKQQAFDFAEKYLEHASAVEGLPRDTTLYRITEGNEPFIFTKYFDDWDPAKAVVQGSSFEKKLAAMLGRPSLTSEGSKRHMSFENTENTTVGKGSTLSPMGHGSIDSSVSTQRASALAALSTSLKTAGMADTPRPSHLKPIRVRVPSNEDLDTADKEVQNAGLHQPGAETTSAVDTQGSSFNGNSSDNLRQHKNGTDVVQDSAFISYEKLKASSNEPVPGLDPKRRESYLSPEEFKKVFGMDQQQFYKLPKWKQDMQKKARDLF